MRIQVQILFPILLHLDPNSSGGEGGGDPKPSKILKIVS